MKKAYLTFLLLSVVYSVKAQYHQTIESNRPGNSVNVFTVGKNVFQVETGFDYIEKSNTFLSNTFLKYGASDRFEIIGGIIYDHSDDTDQNNLYSVGAKYNIYEGDYSSPSVGVQALFNFPSSSSLNSSSSVLFLFTHTPDEKWSYTFNFGTSVDFGKSDVIENSQPKSVVLIEGVYTANLGYVINSKWAAFVESYGGFNRYDDPKIRVNFNAGLSYLVTNNLQLDFLSGYNKKVNDGFSVGAGFSWRLVPN